MSRISLRLRYGKDNITVKLPGSMLMGEYSFDSPEFDGESDVLVQLALDNPVGSQRLCELAHAGQRVAILCSDITRPCPTDFLLPFLLEELSAANIPDDDISGS
jgi:nickel-dependent lactate racemase